jgi:hypothetical protein
MLQMDNFSIPARIAIACLVPMLAFVVFAFKDIAEKHAIYSTADRITALAAAAPDISSLIRELQRERGATAGFVNSKGAAFGKTLQDQRGASDKAIAGWQRTMAVIGPSTLSEKFTSDLHEVRTGLESLPNTRGAADSFS